MGSLSYEINESRNKSKEYNGVHNIGSIPLKSVRKVLLDTIMFFYPDVLMHSGFTKVSTIQPSHRLRCTFKQRASTIHSIIYDFSWRIMKRELRESRESGFSFPDHPFLILLHKLFLEKWLRVSVPRLRESFVPSRDKKFMFLW